MRYSQAIQTVIENRKRIINESIGIVERSTNIETVVSRKNVLIENIDWFIEAERNDHRINSNPPPYILKDQVIRLFNDKLLEIIEVKVEAKIERVCSLKSPAAKQKALNSAVGLIHLNVDKFDKEDTSYSYRIEPKLRSLYDKVEELSQDIN